jgi:hypothetical protein
MQSASKAPATLRAAQALFGVNTVIWVAFAVVTWIRRAGGGRDSAVGAVVMAVLMLGNAGAMLAAGIGLGRQQRRYYWLALAVLVVNIVLTVTDQLGLIDFLTLVLDVVLLGLVVWTRRRQE